MSETTPAGGWQSVEDETREWLRERYIEGLAKFAQADAVWTDAGQPNQLTPYRFQEIQRKVRIFSLLDRLDFESFIDVGSGFDVYPKLVRERYGASAWFSDFTHSFNLPYGGEDSAKLDRAVTANAVRMPFADNTFDVVLSSEVLEHLVRPVEAIAELLRISRKYVIMTSLEALSCTWWQRTRSHFNVDVTSPMTERNFFVLDELDAIFGPDWHHENLLYNPDLPASVLDSQSAQGAAYASIRDVESLVDSLRRATRVQDHRPGAMGIVLLRAKSPGSLLADRPGSEDELIRWLIQQTASFERVVKQFASGMRSGDELPVERDRPIDPRLAALLRCPDCLERLTVTQARLDCESCGGAYRSQYGVPILDPKLPDDGRSIEKECLDRLCGEDRGRRRTVLRTMRRLRRNEAPAGPVRRLAWRFSR